MQCTLPTPSEYILLVLRSTGVGFNLNQNMKVSPNPK